MKIANPVKLHEHLTGLIANMKEKRAWRMGLDQEGGEFVNQNNF
jgi:hypothetical protein